MKLAVGINKSDAVVLPKFAIEPEYAVVCAISGKRICINHVLPRCAIIRYKCADGPASYFARQAAAPQRINHPPRKHQIQRRGKITGVLLKEGPLFRKENFEALVHRDLRIIGFDLPEIRIDGGVKNQAVFQHDLRIQPGFRLQMFAGKALPGRITRV